MLVSVKKHRFIYNVVGKTLECVLGKDRAYVIDIKYVLTATQLVMSRRQEKTREAGMKAGQDYVDSWEYTPKITGPNGCRTLKRMIMEERGLNPSKSASFATKFIDGDMHNMRSKNLIIAEKVTAVDGTGKHDGYYYISTENNGKGRTGIRKDKIFNYFEKNFKDTSHPVILIINGVIVAEKVDKGIVYRIPKEEVLAGSNKYYKKERTRVKISIDDGIIHHQHGRDPVPYRYSADFGRGRQAVLKLNLEECKKLLPGQEYVRKWKGNPFRINEDKTCSSLSRTIMDEKGVPQELHARMVTKFIDGDEHNLLPDNIEFAEAAYLGVSKSGKRFTITSRIQNKSIGFLREDANKFVNEHFKDVPHTVILVAEGIIVAKKEAKIVQ